MDGGRRSDGETMAKQWRSNESTMEDLIDS